jgi:tRNA U55 pseudouridine synthase TruB
MPFVTGLDKRYTGELRLGVRTETDDASGAVTAVDESWGQVSDERLRQAMLDLTGALGEALGCGAHLVALRRVQVGAWLVEQATPLVALASGVPLQPMAAAVAHVASRTLTATEQALVRHGRSIPAGAPDPGPVALLADGRLVAIALPREGALFPKVVLEA